MADMKIPPASGHFEANTVKKTKHQGGHQPEHIVTPKPEGAQHQIQDHIQSIKLPGGDLTSILGKLYSPVEEIIDNTVSHASVKMMGARQDALQGFHHSIAKMNQNDLDEMKDALVKNLASPESSQWDRDLFQQMYDITDAVSEHRQPPHLNLKPSFDPGFNRPLFPDHNKIDPGFNLDPGIYNPPIFPDHNKIDPGFKLDPGIYNPPIFPDHNKIDPGFSIDPGFNRDPGIFVKPDNSIDYK